MIQINLLPGGAQKRPAAARGARPSLGLLKVGGDPRVAAVGGAAFLLLAFAGWSWWSTGNAHAQLSADVEREQADSVRLARTISLMETLEARRDTIESKIAIIRGVDTRRYVWPHLVDEVSRAVPPFTWLTKLAAGDEPDAPAASAPAAPPATAADSAKADSAKAAAAAVPEGPAFSVEGGAGSTQALTRFMKQLESSPMIRDVALVTSEQTATAGRTYLKFTLEGRYEQPDSSFLEIVPVLPSGR